LLKAFIGGKRLKARLWHSSIDLHLLNHHSRWEIVEDDEGCIEEKYPGKKPI
jgi:hypothetical protein